MTSSLIESAFEQLRKQPKRIVFPEGRDPRVLQAAATYNKQGLGETIVLGNKTEIEALAKQSNVDLSHLNIIDPKESPSADVFAKDLTSLHRYKDSTHDEARSVVTESGYFGSFLLRNGEVDGLVGGATSYSGSLLRPLFQIIKPTRKTKTISSCMVLELPDRSFGENGILVCADCAVIPNPTAEQLAFITIETCRLMSRFPECAPRAAMLSYSTKGSAVTADTEKMVTATALAKKILEEDSLSWVIDGELQVDAALVPQISDTKSPANLLHGRANILIFPDLNAGNIGMKLIHRLCRAKAYGQILLGLSKPAADLSRGASVEEIIGVAAIVGLNAIHHENQ